MSRSERTIRDKGQWVKITRDSKARRFSFARGRDGSYVAINVQSWSFASIATWADAEEFAQRQIDTFA